MDYVHWHLLLSHAPQFGAIGGFGLLAYGVIRKLKSIERAGLVILILSAMITVPTYLTGEQAEERVEHLEGFSEGHIEQHEKVATLSFRFMMLTGLAIVAWFNRSFGKASAAIRWFAVRIAMTAMIMFSVTAYLGGKAGHREVRDKTLRELFSVSSGGIPPSVAAELGTRFVPLQPEKCLSPCASLHRYWLQQCYWSRAVGPVLQIQTAVGCQHPSSTVKPAHRPSYLKRTITTSVTSMKGSNLNMPSSSPTRVTVTC